MHHGTSLFDQLRTPAARNDPRSSHDAAAEIAVSGARAHWIRKVADLVASMPGLTSREYADRSKLDRHGIAKRLPDAEQAGLVRRGAFRTCSIGGRTALTWWPMDDGSDRDMQTDP